MPLVRVRLTDGMRALLNDDGVRAELTARAGRVLDAAQAGAPVKTGAYRDSLHIAQGTTDRAAVAVGSDVPYALRVEAEHGVLARALGAAS